VTKNKIKIKTSNSQRDPIENESRQATRTLSKPGVNSGSVNNSCSTYDIGRVTITVTFDYMFYNCMRLI